MPAHPPTLVTAVCDLGLDTLNPPFRQEPARDGRHLSALLSIDLPMVVYVDVAHEALVRTLRGDKPTRIQRVDPAALAAHELYAPVQRIRSDPRWLAGADWLPESPQARLPHYNPVVFSKPLWLYEQAQRNPFGSTHLYWIDARLGEEGPRRRLSRSPDLRESRLRRSTRSPSEFFTSDTHLDELDLGRSRRGNAGRSGWRRELVLLAAGNNNLSSGGSMQLILRSTRMMLGTATFAFSMAARANMALVANAGGWFLHGGAHIEANPG